MKRKKSKNLLADPGHSEKNNSAMADPQQRIRVHNRMKELLLAGTTVSIGLSATLCGIACDPVPPPVWTCSDSTSNLWKSGLTGEAAWHQVNQEWNVTVQLTLDSWIKQTALIKFSGVPVLAGAIVKTDSVDPASVHFSCVPDTGVQQIAARVPMKCDSGAISLNFGLDVSGTRRENAQVPIRPVASRI